MLKGQVALEFLIVFLLAIPLFIAAIIIYQTDVAEASYLNDELESTRICISVASAINSFASLEGDATHTFNLPPDLNYKEYTVRINSQQKIVKVDYEDAGIGCALHISNITNSMNETAFVLQKNATVKNIDGVISIEP